MAMWRREEPRDADAVWRVNELAFGEPTEANLVRDLTAAGASTLSLVAEKDGYVVGHILFSPVTIETPAGQVTAIGLAPMAVLPDQQGKGIGTRLVQEGLAQLRRLGYDAVVLVGHPDYYPRFGFKRASRFGGIQTSSLTRAECGYSPGRSRARMVADEGAEAAATHDSRRHRGGRRRGADGRRETSALS